jgi:hypothetical protein
MAAMVAMIPDVLLPGSSAEASGRSRPLPAVIQQTAERWRPEGMYFTTFDGRRTAYLVFDMADASDLPPFAEPFFSELNADVQIAPVMDGDDLQKGLSQIG